MTVEKLKEVLELHKKWINGEDGGSLANLRDVDLTGADLKYVDLTGANLRYADLKYADLTGANLKYADLTGVDLTGANLTSVDLTSSDLRDANLTGANIDFSSLTFSCKTIGIITDDKIKIQYLFHCAKQKGEIIDSDLKELFESELFKKVCNKFNRVNECGSIL